VEGGIKDLSKYRFECSIEALEDFFVASKEEAKQQIERAEKFQELVKHYLYEKEIVTLL
jgi:hypothetical protein